MLPLRNLLSVQHPFSEKDLAHLQNMGKKPSDAVHEYLSLIHGAPHTKLRRPCSAGDGILQLSAAERERYAREFRTHADRGRAMKFVAASGAASRMFKTHIRYCALDGVNRRQLLAEKASGSPEAEELLRFFDNLPRFPFFGQLRLKLASRGLDLDNLACAGSYSPILHCLLDSDGMGYGDAPKGLIPFHAYPDGARTPFEEHLLEAAGYLRDGRGAVRVHFTVPPEDEARVRQHLEGAARRFMTPETSYDATLSIQDRSTDAVALTARGSLIRGTDGHPRLWPSGHGALLKNLNDLQADIVFVRTIDNVLPDRLKDTVAFFKRVLGGLLAELQVHIFHTLEMLESGDPGRKELGDIEEWSREFLNLRFPRAAQDAGFAAKRRMLFESLNRPLRVCAMVKHDGEPGGGPFWVGDESGEETLQIIEGAQVDVSSEEQKTIWESSSYFNPADLVCGVRDHRGNPFDLAAYADPNAAFVSNKAGTAGGIRVLERPGLWNGSMARWNTVFVEVPKATLCPAKTILDLLRPEHQV